MVRRSVGQPDSVCLCPVVRTGTPTRKACGRSPIWLSRRCRIAVPLGRDNVVGDGAQYVIENGRAVDGRRDGAGRMWARNASAAVRQPATPAGPTTTAAAFAEKISQAVTKDAMMAHVTKLQEIADEHGGNRALGSPGYDASVDYVANTLRDKGFDVQTPEFEVRLPDQMSRPSPIQAPKSRPFRWSTPSAPGPTAWRVSWCPPRVEDSPGCTASDYDGLPVKGAVVLIDRRKVPVRRQTGRGCRTRCGRPDRRQQCRRRPDGSHTRPRHRREDSGHRSH